MGAQRFVYRQRKDGTVRALLLKGALELRKDLEMDAMSFHERVMRSYYEVECEGGPYRGAYPKNMVRRVHQEAIEKGK